VFCAITGAAATMATAAHSADSGNPDPNLLLIPITPVVRAADARLMSKIVTKPSCGGSRLRRPALWIEARPQR
jgi:hypothetical protein